MFDFGLDTSVCFTHLDGDAQEMKGPASAYLVFLSGLEHTRPQADIRSHLLASGGTRVWGALHSQLGNGNMPCRWRKCRCHSLLTSTQVLFCHQIN